MAHILRKKNDGSLPRDCWEVGLFVTLFSCALYSDASSELSYCKQYVGQCCRGITLILKVSLFSSHIGSFSPEMKKEKLRRPGYRISLAQF